MPSTTSALPLARVAACLLIVAVASLPVPLLADSKDKKKEKIHISNGDVLPPDVVNTISLPERPPLPEKVERPERPQRPDRPEKPDKPEKPDRPERPEKPDLPERPARG